MILVYRQQRDEVLPITRAWITDNNEIYGQTVAGNEILLGEYDDDCQSQHALDEIYDAMPGPKVEMPENFENQYVLEKEKDR